MIIKTWLKKIVPPTISIFNREIRTLRESNESLAQKLDAVQQENTELLKRIDAAQFSIHTVQSVQGEFWEKYNGLSSALEETRARQTEIADGLNGVRDALKDIGDTVHGRPTSDRAGYECFATNVNKEMWEIAGRESALFALEKMVKSESLPDAAALREFALKRADDGLYLEFGVFSGDSINQIARLKPDQAIYGFDSFEGLPEKWRGGFKVGDFQTDSLPAVENNVTLVKGWFDQSLPGFLAEHPGSCAFIHVDCDLYSSAKTVFTLLAERIVPGTVLVFDEYFNYPSWEEHEHKAFMEFLEEQKLDCDFIGYVGSHQQAAAVIKQKSC